jgi:hypothetical protein
MGSDTERAGDNVIEPIFPGLRADPGWGDPRPFESANVDEGESSRRQGMQTSQKVVLGIFALLLLGCTALLISVNFVGPMAQEAISGVASDGFKTVLGALVGALSAILLWAQLETVI